MFGLSYNEAQEILTARAEAEEYLNSSLQATEDEGFMVTNPGQNELAKDAVARLDRLVLATIRRAVIREALGCAQRPVTTRRVTAK